MKVRRLLCFVGRPVLVLIVWYVVFAGVGSFVTHVVLGVASAAEVAGAPRVWILFALIVRPLASAVAGGVGGVLGMRRPWLWGGVAGGVPALFVTVCTYRFLTLMVPEAAAAEVIGLLLSVAVAALGGGLAAGALCRYRSGWIGQPTTQDDGCTPTS